MSQHDMNIANASGSAVRTDLNNALVALVGNNSGASEPSTMFAYMWWADTTTGLLKIRNAANAGWITVGTLATLSFLPLAGGTLTGHLLFTDATYDIGAAGATRPRSIYMSGTLTSGGNIVASGGTVSAAALALTGASGAVVADTATTNLYGYQVQNNKANNVANSGRIQISCLDSASNADPAYALDAGLITVTSGAENGKVQWSTMRAGSQQNFMVWTSGATAGGLSLPQNASAPSAGGGLSVTFIGAGTQYGMVMRPANDTTTHIHFDNAAGASQGSITDNGAGVIAYNAFVGAHDSQLQGGQRAPILSGTIMEAVDEMCEFGFSDELLPRCKVSDTPASPRAYGVFFRYMEEDQVEEPQYDLIEKPRTEVKFVNGRLIKNTTVYTERVERTELREVYEENGDRAMAKTAATVDADGREVEPEKLEPLMHPVAVVVTRPGNVDCSVAGLGQFQIRMQQGQPIQTGYVESAGDGTGRFQAAQVIGRNTIAEVNAAVVIKVYDDGSFLMPARLMKG